MKKFFSLITITFILISLFTISSVRAAETTSMYACITATSIDEDNFGNESLGVLFYDNNGSEYLKWAANTITVNGKDYDFKTKIPDGVFAKLTISNDAITAIDYDLAPKTVYNDVTYNTGTKKFNNVSTDTSSLPIYYKHNGEFTAPVLDNNHKYNIEIYNYAVNITSFSILEPLSEISYIRIADDMNQNFTRNINILCAATKTGTVLSVQLFGSDSALISEKRTDLINNAGGYEISFENLPNSNAEYTLKLWLEDASGAVVTQVYTKPYTLTAAEILYGYIEELYNANTNMPEILFLSNKGEKMTYSADAENLTLNGKKYSDSREFQTGVFAKFTVLNGKINAISYDTDYSSFNSVSYNTAQKCFNEINNIKYNPSVPVYYKQDGKFTEPVLDEKHKYNIKAYDYAVLITAEWTTQDDICLSDLSYFVTEDSSQGNYKAHNITMLLSNNADADKEVTVMAAFYSSQRLVNIENRQVSSKANDKCLVDMTAQCGENIDYIKIFIWKDLRSLDPYTSSIVINTAD